jgi:hypothetical protein
MTMTLTQIEAEVFQLPVEQQLQLVDKISHHVTAADDSVGLDIALKRASKIDAGKGSFIDLDTSMKQIHKALEKQR